MSSTISRLLFLSIDPSPITLTIQNQEDLPNLVDFHVSVLACDWEELAGSEAPNSKIKRLEKQVQDQKGVIEGISEENGKLKVDIVQVFGQVNH